MAERILYACGHNVDSNNNFPGLNVSTSSTNCSNCNDGYRDWVTSDEVGMVLFEQSLPD